MKTWVANVSIKQAFESTFKQNKHGAVIETGGVIVSRGKNATRPHAPQPAKYGIHAEVAAIHRARGKTIGANLYVARVTKGFVRNSKPCIDCQKTIRESGIKRVFYSISSEEWVEWKLW